MTKYKEALERCSIDLEDRIKNDNILLTGRIDIEMLQELVDKATPKKIVYRDFMKNTPQHELIESCPNCNCVFDYNALGKKHCSNCGQAINWNDD